MTSKILWTIIVLISFSGYASAKEASSHKDDLQFLLSKLKSVEDKIEKKVSRVDPETDVDHINRINDFDDLIGGGTSKRIFNFEFESGFEYSQSKELLYPSITIVKHESQGVAITSTSRTKRYTYLGSNAFGVSVNVSAEDNYEKGISLLITPQLMTDIESDSYSNLMFRPFHITPDEFSKIKGNKIVIRIQGSLMSPKIVRDSSFREAKIDDPHQFKYEFEGVMVRPTSLTFLNSARNVIFSKNYYGVTEDHNDRLSNDDGCSPIPDSYVEGVVGNGGAACENALVRISLLYRDSISHVPLPITKRGLVKISNNPAENTVSGVRILNKYGGISDAIYYQIKKAVIGMRTGGERTIETDIDSTDVYDKAGKKLEKVFIVISLEEVIVDNFNDISIGKGQSVEDGDTVRIFAKIMTLDKHETLTITPQFAYFLNSKFQAKNDSESLISRALVGMRIGGEKEFEIDSKILRCALWRCHDGVPSLMAYHEESWLKENKRVLIKIIPEGFVSQFGGLE